MANKVPTTVFTGFLGSGKTTIIAHLVDELQSAGQQVIYIKNEIGNENIDAQLMQGKHIQTKELLNGCICCTLVGPFIHAIDEIIDTLNPTRIIIEASGAADPAALALMIDSHPRLTRDGVLVVVDVVNFDGYTDLSTTAQNQTKFTDLIIFNKIEQVDLDRKKAVVGYVRELNTHSPIVEAPQGKVASSVVFGIASDELDILLKNEGFDDHTDTHNHPHEHHLEQDGIESFSLYPDGLLPREAVQQFLEKLPPSVYRVKGIFKDTSDESCIINKVGTRTILENQQSSSKSVIVLIGFKILQFKEKIQAELSNLTTTA
ncbi:MAG: hypothetical protein QG639_901 [Patescibacteria group bacterium]|nr:hypothetical protein [Patescibacteria group bacterium]